MAVTLIYVYILVCIVIVLYVAGFTFSLRSRDKKKAEATVQFKEELAGLKAAGTDSEAFKEHREKVRKEAEKIGVLSSYAESVKESWEEEKMPTGYWQNMEETYRHLAQHYKGARPEERAYFVQFIADYASHFSDRRLFETLATFLDGRNVYVKENVLQALYQFGDVSLIQSAFRTLSSQNRFHHSKLIADGLMLVPRGKQELADALWQEFSFYSESIQVGIVRFILQTSEDYQKAFLQFLQKGKGSLDVRLEMVRYFRKYPYEPAYPYLTDLMEPSDTSPVEYRIVAARVLGAYPRPETVDILKKAVEDREWYVRVNASQSLMDLNVPEAELESVLSGPDRFAKEMLAYRLTEKEAQHAE